MKKWYRIFTDYRSDPFPWFYVVMFIWSACVILGLLVYCVRKLVTGDFE